MTVVVSKSVPHFLDKRVTKVGELLTLKNLVIPKYQRPYKWTQANLADLLNDLKVYRQVGVSFRGRWCSFTVTTMVAMTMKKLSS